jgi:RNA recognition motif-containing protein
MTFGQVTSVSMMNDKYIGSGQSMGYGFVVMVSLSEGQAAITGLAGKKLRGMAATVVEALPVSARLVGTGALRGTNRVRGILRDRER